MLEPRDLQTISDIMSNHLDKQLGAREHLILEYVDKTRTVLEEYIKRLEKNMDDIKKKIA